MRISLIVKSGCLAISPKIQSECSSNGDTLPPAHLGTTLPVSLQLWHQRMTELIPTRKISAASRRDAPFSTASTARSRKSVEYGFGMSLAPQANQFPHTRLGKSSWESPRFNLSGKCSRNLGLKKNPMDQGRSQLRSCFITARKLGIWAPDDRILGNQRAYGFVRDYLMRVGNMLYDGDFPEAKQYAARKRDEMSHILEFSRNLRRHSGRRWPSVFCPRHGASTIDKNYSTRGAGNGALCALRVVR